MKKLSGQDIRFEKKENTDGSTTKETEVSASGFVTENGLTVDYSCNSQLTTDSDGVVTGASETQYSVAGDQYGAAGGR